MITVKDLTVAYGLKIVLRNLNFSVAKGEWVAIVGPNGSGKSTLLKVLAGILGLTSGTVQVAGLELPRNRFAAKKKIGYLGDPPLLEEQVTVDEQLRFISNLRDADAWAVGSELGLRPVAEERVGHLSQGYQRRLGLALAFAAEPSILLLDEPFVGLDDGAVRCVKRQLQEKFRSKTIVFSSHVPSEVAMADRVVGMEELLRG